MNLIHLQPLTICFICGLVFDETVKQIKIGFFNHKKRWQNSGNVTEMAKP